jgi:hypothetical protein
LIQRLKPYAEMKDSGVAWLGAVPRHWRLLRLKSTVSNIVDQTAERLPGEGYLALEHVESWTGRIRAAGADVVFDSQVTRFHPDDVLIGKLRPYLAKVTRPAVSGVCVGEFLVLRAKSVDVTSAFVENWLRSKPVIDAINSSTFGAKMPRADWQFIGGMTVAIPNRVAADKAYQNAKQNSDNQNARIEHDKALARVMTAVLKDDTELFKQFMDNESFRRWLTDTVFGITYGVGPPASGV